MAPGTCVTDKGTVHAEHVVNCAGLWAREVGQLVGIELPVLAMEHHYLLTEDIPELEGREQGDRQHHRLRRARSTCARNAAAR